MSTDRVLLDTTVQLWRVAYGPEEAEPFHRELIDKEVFTTSFVFREFLNTLIADLEYVHVQATDILQPDEDGRAGLDQLSRFLATGQGNYSVRSARRLHLVIGSLLGGFAQTRVPKSKILTRLERTANRWIRDFFRHPKQGQESCPITCLTDLDEGPDELESLRTGRPFPPRPTFPRAAAALLEQSEKRVIKVEEAMRAATKAQGRDDKLFKVLGWLKDRDGTYVFSTKLQPPKTWNWALGDLLIALETPQGVSIYSTDRAFSILARALDQPRHLGYRTPADRT